MNDPFFEQIIKIFPNCPSCNGNGEDCSGIRAIKGSEVKSGLITNSTFESVCKNSKKYNELEILINTQWIISKATSFNTNYVDFVAKIIVKDNKSIDYTRFLSLSENLKYFLNRDLEDISVRVFTQNYNKSPAPELTYLNISNFLGLDSILKTIGNERQAILLEKFK